MTLTWLNKAINVMPQNMVVVQGRPGLSEHGKEMVYAIIGAKISLWS